MDASHRRRDLLNPFSELGDAGGRYPDSLAAD
jgi:hypothetical protein